VRVIGGSSRGRRLPARLPAGVRPTSDRVREAIFDILGSMGGVEGLSVVDLFCGSGALGAEALSRGAAAVTLVDHDPDALEAVRANLAAAGLDRLSGQTTSVVRAELPSWLGRAGPFELAFCDPPYAFDDWATLLGSLRAAVAVLESGEDVAVPAGWAVTKSRRYGGTLVTVVRQALDDATEAADRSTHPATIA
jgi:16S rRNA (guanine966-N2)-methyltransferase